MNSKYLNPCYLSVLYEQFEPFAFAREYVFIYCLDSFYP